MSLVRHPHFLLSQGMYTSKHLETLYKMLTHHAHNTVDFRDGFVMNGSTVCPFFLSLLFLCFILLFLRNAFKFWLSSFSSILTAKLFALCAMRQGSFCYVRTSRAMCNTYSFLILSMCFGALYNSNRISRKRHACMSGHVGISSNDVADAIAHCVPPQLKAPWYLVSLVWPLRRFSVDACWPDDKRLIPHIMDFACPIWKQVSSHCDTSACWYISNR